MEIIFLLPVSTDSYLRKRVNGLRHEGVDPVIFAFERNQYPAKPWLGYYTLGFIKNGHYLERIPYLLRATLKVRKHVKGNSIIYCFGFDMLLVGWLACLGKSRKKTLIYEVADIVELLLKKGIIGSFLRWLERLLSKKVALLVVTSKAYVDHYFMDIQKLYNLPYIELENKIFLLDLQDVRDTAFRKERNDDNIIIGYFGIIRCRKSLEILKETVKRARGRIKVYIRGILIDSLHNMKEDLLRWENVYFGGPYTQDELNDLYSKVDISWLPTYTVMCQIKWAKTNRFYEACFFKCPMIAQLGTQDGILVEKNKLGLIIDLNDFEGSIVKILNIEKHHLQVWRGNIIKLPKDMYVYTDEHKLLLDKIKEITIR